MKKIIALILAAVLIVGSLTACGEWSDKKPDGRIKIVATIFPEYDWVKNVLGDRTAQAELTMLLDTGVDLHSYQPTASDILKISSCDLFIYVGGESDGWVEAVLKEAKNKDMIVINLLEALGDAAKSEEVVEGMQEEEHDHDHEDGEDDDDHDEQDHDEEIEYDEHVWLSLRNAGILTERISEALQKIDPEHAGTYKANAEAYIGKLNALDAEYKSAVANAAYKTILFGDRFPFRYLTDDYGLTYYAAFVGCSAETEASFETITFLSNKVAELSLPAVLTIEGASHKIAETIINNTPTKDQKILTLDSMQGTTAKDVAAGKTYLSVMESNLAVLKDALK